MRRLTDLKTGQPIPTRAEAVTAAQLQVEVERLYARIQQLGHANGS